MAQRIIECRKCGEEFVSQPGKPGYVNVCLACTDQDGGDVVERHVALPNPRDRTGTVFAIARQVGGWAVLEGKPLEAAGGAVVEGDLET